MKSSMKKNIQSRMKENVTPVQFSMDDDIIDICHDNVFKAVFTQNTPTSRGALQLLLSAHFKTDVSVEVVDLNELPGNSVTDRQIRFDINVTFSNDRHANVEMTMFPSAFERLRMEYYAARLHVSQDIRGKNLNYDSLTETYQISFIGGTKNIWDDGALVHRLRFTIRNTISGLTDGCPLSR